MIKKQRLLIVEGADKNWKTTVTRNLQEIYALPYFKHGGEHQAHLSGGGKGSYFKNLLLWSQPFFVDFLNQTGASAIFDRTYPSEFVYSYVFGREFDMAAFEYRALDAGGRSRKGVLTGDSPRQVRSWLRGQGFFPLEVQQIEEQSGAGGTFRLSRSVSSADLALMTRQLATLVRAGMPLEQALRALGEQAGSRQLQSVITGVRAHITEGLSLGEALARFPGTFPQMYRAMVEAYRAGDLSGADGQAFSMAYMRPTTLPGALASVMAAYNAMHTRTGYDAHLAAVLRNAIDVLAQIAGVEPNEVGGEYFMRPVQDRAR